MSESEVDIVEQIVQATDNVIDDFDDVDRTLNKYASINVLFMKLILIPRISSIYFYLCATFYNCEELFIQKFLDKNIVKVFQCEQSSQNHTLIATLAQRRDRIKYMKFEYHKRYIAMEVESPEMTDIMKMDIVPLTDELYSRTLMIIGNITKIRRWRDFTSNLLIDNAFSYACNSVYTDYSKGIDGFVKIDKKLAIYFQFIACKFLKGVSNEETVISMHDALLDNYSEALKDGIEMDFVVHSYYKLTKLIKKDPMRQLAREKFEKYVVITTLKESKVLEIDREHVANECMTCGATRKLKTCARCKVSRFCNAECMRIAWPVHKSQCLKWAAERAEETTD